MSTRPVPKPRTRTLTRSGELSSSPSATRSDEDEGEGRFAPRSPQEAWVAVDNAQVVKTGSPEFASDANQMYTNDDENEEEFKDSLELHDLEEPTEWSSTSGGLGGRQMQASRYHPEDTLKDYTSQAPVIMPHPSSITPVRTSPGSKLYQEESKLLLREVTDLKNQKISLTQEIVALSEVLSRKKADIEELEHKLQSREKSLRDREHLSAVEKGNIDLKLKKIILKEKELEDRESTLLLRQHALDERESLLVEQEVMRSGAAQLEKERASLRVAETEVKKRDEALHKWSRELHEEAERLRLKEIDQERDFQNRLTALSIYAEESQQGGVRLDELVGGSSGTPLTAAVVEDPKVKEDADMAARLQQELWQVCVCVCACVRACVYNLTGQ